MSTSPESELAQRRLAILVDASQAFVEAGLDPSNVLTTVVQRVTELTGDGCLIALLAESGAWLTPAAWQHPEPQTRGPAPLHPTVQQPAHPDVLNRVARTGQPLLIPVVDPAELAALLQPVLQPEIFPLAPASLMIVPLRARGRVIGVLLMARLHPGDPYTVDDLVFSLALADRAAVAIDNAHLYQAAQTAEAHYRAIFANVGDAIFVLDDEWRYIDANDAVSELVGYPRDELLQKRLGEAAFNVPAAIARRWRQIPATASWHGELEALRRDGSIVPVEVRLTAVQLPAGRVYILVARDISERRALEQARRDFYAMVAHELKNPLTAIKAYSQLMQLKGAYDEHALQVILRQERMLERLAGDLLDVARLEAGRPVLQRETVDLVELARTCVEQIGAQHPEAVIQLEAPWRPIEGAWDRGRIEQVLNNLLVNAVKYTPSGAQIVVRVEDLGAAARVAVTDQGMGIPVEEMPLLFGRFYRTRSAAAGRQHGSGLGLYIARLLVEAHGGRIEATSQVGEGSTFLFTLPRGTPPAERDQPTSA